MRKLYKIMLKAVFVAVSLWLIGFAVFIIALPKPANNPYLLSSVSDAPKLGIVAYTGGGGQRISNAMGLFDRGIGERLLISGVHPNTSREVLQKLWKGNSQQFVCCVDLGMEAQSTRGNARELSKWVQTYNLQHIVLVTSDYHTPRALIETKAQLKAVTIIAAPSRSGYITRYGYPSDIASLKVLSVEYSKYLFANLILLMERF